VKRTFRAWTSFVFLGEILPKKSSTYITKDFPWKKHGQNLPDFEINK
jgi:hypothetical protein